MQFVIDGYNLLYAIGLAPKPGGISLERSRLRLVEWLAARLVKDVADVCVIFDAVHNRGDSEQVHRGIRMRFSSGETADDFIEKLIRDEPAPAQLTIVSNDNRLQAAARRRGCVPLTCGDYVERLIVGEKEARPKRPVKVLSDKPESTTEDEMADWLRRFEVKK